MADARGAVPLFGSLLGLGQHGIVATFFGVGGGHGLRQLLLQQGRGDDLLDVGLLGHVASGERLLEGLLALEHRLGLLQLGIDVGLLHRYVVLLGSLLVEVLVDVVVDNFLAHGLGRGAV